MHKVQTQTYVYIYIYIHIYVCVLYVYLIYNKRNSSLRYITIHVLLVFDSFNVFLFQ